MADYLNIGADLAATEMVNFTFRKTSLNYKCYRAVNLQNCQIQILPADRLNLILLGKGSSNYFWLNPAEKLLVARLVGGGLPLWRTHVNVCNLTGVRGAERVICVSKDL